MNRLTAKLKTFLLWSQKYTRTDMLYLAKGGFWLTFGQFAGSGLVLLTTILFARLLPKETYGTYKYVLSIGGLLAIATLPQMSTAITQAVARGYDGVLTRTLKTRLAWGLLGTAAGLALAAWYALHGNGLLAGAMVILALLLPTSIILQQYDAFLLGRKLFSQSVTYALAVQACSAAALIAAAVFLKSVPALLIAFFGARLLANAVIFLQVRRKFAPNGKVEPGAESYGKHLTLMGLFSTVADALDNLLVYHFLGAAQLAVYAIAVGPPDQMKGLLANLDTLAFPKMAEADEKALRAGMTRKFIQLTVFGALAIGAYIAAAPVLYRFIFPAYKESVFYSQVFALGLLNMALFPAGTYLRAKKKIKEQYYAGVISSVFQVAAMCLGVWKWGLLGLVVARVLTRYVSVLINLHYYLRMGRDTVPTSSAPALPG